MRCSRTSSEILIRHKLYKMHGENILKDLYKVPKLLRSVRRTSPERHAKAAALACRNLSIQCIEKQWTNQQWNRRLLATSNCSYANFAIEEGVQSCSMHLAESAPVTPTDSVTLQWTQKQRRTFLTLISDAPIVSEFPKMKTDSHISATVERP